MWRTRSGYECVACPTKSAWYSKVVHIACMFTLMVMRSANDTYNRIYFNASNVSFGCCFFLSFFRFICLFLIFFCVAYNRFSLSLFVPLPFFLLNALVDFGVFAVYSWYQAEKIFDCWFLVHVINTDLDSLFLHFLASPWFLPIPVNARWNIL